MADLACLVSELQSCLQQSLSKKWQDFGVSWWGCFDFAKNVQIILLPFDRSWVCVKLVSLLSKWARNYFRVRLCTCYAYHSFLQLSVWRDSCHCYGWTWQWSKVMYILHSRFTNFFSHFHPSIYAVSKVRRKAHPNPLTAAEKLAITALFKLVVHMCNVT